MGREIITLQLGHHANFVGTHFWNTQDEYFRASENNASPEREIDHDVLFRTGQSLWGGETFTPRLVLFDLRGSFRTLKKISDLYKPPISVDAATWGGDVYSIVQEPYPQNEYLRHLSEEDAVGQADGSEQQNYGNVLDKVVDVWSDFNRLFYHPHTAVEIPQYQHKPSWTDQEETVAHSTGLGSFDTYSQGYSLLGDREWTEDVVENAIRFFVEESDSIQGFNMFADCNNGFAGLSTNLIEYLREESPKTAITVYGVWGNTSNPYSVNQITNSKQFERDLFKKVNLALMIEKLSQHSALSFVPIFASHKHANDRVWKHVTSISSAYRTSAYISAAIETLTLPQRYKRDPAHMHDLVTMMTAPSRLCNMASLSTAMPLPIWPSASDSEAISSVVKYDQKARVPWLEGLSSGDLSYVTDTVAAQFCSVRGLADVLPRASRRAVEEFPSSLDAFLSSFMCPMGYTQRRISSLAFPLGEAYPQFFDPQVTTSGYIDPFTKRSDEPVIQVPVMSLLQTTPAMQNLVHVTMGAAEGLGTAQFLRYAGDGKGGQGLTVEEFREILEGLENVQSAFSELAD
ncbi:Misato segment II tubulin-like domain-containing protein [Cladochytrium replicatum]|nr:Misato segment II tubulin-like domain-containing protein [Cladochytrium replicatum]